MSYFSDLRINSKKRLVALLGIVVVIIIVIVVLSLIPVYVSSTKSIETTSKKAIVVTSRSKTSTSKARVNFSPASGETRPKSITTSRTTQYSSFLRNTTLENLNALLQTEVIIAKTTTEILQPIMDQSDQPLENSTSLNILSSLELPRKLYNNNF